MPTQMKDKEMILAENRLVELQEQIQKAEQTKSSIQAEISKKTADYEIYIAQRDSETKRIRQETLDQSADLAKQKAEFTEILKKFQIEKVAVEDMRRGISDDKAKIEDRKAAIQSFIISVQRALSVLGL